MTLALAGNSARDPRVAANRRPGMIWIMIGLIWRTKRRRALLRFICREQHPWSANVMDISAGWILLGLVLWGLGSLFVFALCAMARDQDRAARHEEKRIVPYSDVTITQISN
jgi:hypothetical protein